MRSLFAIVAVVVSLGLTVAVEADAAERPNVVLIMTDDQGYGDFGVKGNDVIQTPHLDRLAEGSASMSDFYVHPVCSPTRASLMTGRHNYRTRVIDTWRGRSMMDPAELTIAEALSDAGYRTGIFGKWHLGDAYPMRPVDQGFDEALIHLGGGIGQPSEPLGNERRYTDPILYHNGRKVQTYGYCTDVFTEAANRFIRQAHQNEEPFFVYLATNAPHSPYHDVPEDLYEHYLEKTDELEALIRADFEGDRLETEIDRLARISAMITNIDDNVGRLMAQLESLGLIEDTLVIYLNDNGPNTRRYAGPFRGRKGEMYEGGIRSPLWLHWPAQLSAKARSDRPAAHIDLMPTILEACGAAVPDDVTLDGRSILPLLKGDESVEWPERNIVLQWHRGDAPQRYHHFMIRDGRWKLVNNAAYWREEPPDEPTFELYDLREDPGEMEDLAERQPEIVARLKAAYDDWLDDVSSTRPDNYAPPRIVIGGEENPVKLTHQDLRDGAWRDEGPPGHWMIEVAETGRYDVKVLIDPANDAAETAIVRFGEQTATRQVSAGAELCLIRNVAVEAGPTQFSVALTADGEERAAYQVIVTRR